MKKVYSMSAVSTWKRCSKKFEFQYVRLIDGIRENAAMTSGTNFHKIMEHYGKTGELPEDIDPAMLEVAVKYLDYNKFPDFRSIISAEEPIYVEVLKDVYIRCSMDLVYRRGDGITIRDYKTFDRSPTRDIDLDFQARTYITLAALHFQTEDIMFEHDYVRRTAPYVPKDKAGNTWSPSECYFRDELVMSTDEMASMLRELQYDLKQLMLAEDTPFFTRSHQKGGGYDDCSKCSVKEVCKMDLVNPGLIDIDLTGMVIEREPVTLPEGV